MSTRIEGTTVLICREDISANFPGGVDAFTGTLDAASIRWQVSDPPSDVADESGERLLSLGVQNGIETVLDLETGAQTSTALAQHEPSGTPVHDELLTALDAIGWEYHHSKAPEAYVELPGKTGAYSTKFYAEEQGGILLSFTYAPLVVPLRARRRVMEFVLRANFRMLMGGFDFSMESGVLGVKTSQDVRGHSVTDRGVYAMAWNGVAVLDRYTTQLMEVIYAKRNIREAVEEARAS
ncbi:MAG: YbjN domain-containing protein [bacterium]